MQALTLPAKRGWLWLFDGFKTFRKSPLMLALIVLSYWMLVGMVNAIPFIGQIAATLCFPAFSVSLMNTCRTIEQGGLPPPQLLFSGFKENLRQLLILGLIYLLVGLSIISLSVLIDGGLLFQFIIYGRRLSENEMASSEFLWAVKLSLALFMPLMMAFWYAPVLAAWHGLTAGKALFFSCVACMRNWQVFLNYGIAIMIFGALVPSLILSLLSPFLPHDGGLFSVMLAFTIILVFAPTLYASFYVSYRDVFVTIDENA